MRDDFGDAKLTIYFHYNKTKAKNDEF